MPEQKFMQKLSAEQHVQRLAAVGNDSLSHCGDHKQNIRTETLAESNPVDFLGICTLVEHLCF